MEIYYDAAQTVGRGLSRAIFYSLTGCERSAVLLTFHFVAFQQPAHLRSRLFSVPYTFSIRRPPPLFFPTSSHKATSFVRVISPPQLSLIPALTYSLPQLSRRHLVLYRMHLHLPLIFSQVYSLAPPPSKCSTQTVRSGGFVEHGAAQEKGRRCEGGDPTEIASAAAAVFMCNDRFTAATRDCRRWRPQSD